MHICVAAVIPCLSLLSSEGEGVLEPAWAARFAAGIEWVAPVDAADGVRLLVCARDNRLHLLNLRDGVGLLDPPITVGQGAVFAGAHADHAYLVDPERVCCVAVGPMAGEQAGGARLRWRAGDAAAASAHTDADPEFRARLLAAAAGPRGLLVVRSDGRVVGLEARSGKPLAAWSLGPLSAARLHIDGGLAAVVGVLQGRSVAVLLPEDGSEAPRIIPLGDAPPAWTAVSAERLLALWPAELRIIAADRDVARVTPRTGRFMAAATAAFPDDSVRPRPEAAAPALWAGLDDGSLFRVELHTGRSDETPGPSDAPYERLAVSADLVAAATARGLVVWPRRGAGVGLPARFELPREFSAMGLFVRGRSALAVARRPARGGQTASPARLVRVTLGDAPPSGDVRLRSDQWLLRAADDPRMVAWTPREIVIAGSTELLVYSMPD